MKTWIRAVSAGFGITAVVALLAGPANADAVREAEWYLTYLHAQEAQQISRGQGVVVAVIDTGVDGQQPDLVGNILPGTDEYKGFTGDGRQDAHGHGTGMAGIIAAHGREGNAGLRGIAPAAKILPIRASASGDPFPEDVRKSITWATKHGARIICIALAGAPSDQWAPVLDAAQKADVVVVAGVGNSNFRQTRVAWPAAYPGVLAAAGIDQTGKHADLSVTGPEVDLAAPAVNIVTAGLHGQYVRADGTSAATAIIAGAAALVRAKYPTMPAAEVVHRLEATAIDAGPPGRDDEYGYGILNLVGALTADVPPLRPSTGGSPSAKTPPGPAGAQSHSGSGRPVSGIVLAVLLAVGMAAAAVITVRRRAR